jgi:hypothetical protein
LRSFDRIALTQEIIAQEQASGINTVKADIALDLDVNGVDSIKDDSVTVSRLPIGDQFDFLVHKENPEKSSREDRLGDMFSWDQDSNPDDKHARLNQVLSDFQGAVKESQVSATIAEQGMMTGQNVFDQGWSGDGQDAVKNFVTEELYIHSKV